MAFAFSPGNNLPDNSGGDKTAILFLIVNNRRGYCRERLRAPQAVPGYNLMIGGLAFQHAAQFIQLFQRLPRGHVIRVHGVQCPLYGAWLEACEHITLHDFRYRWLWGAR